MDKFEKLLVTESRGWAGRRGCRRRPVQWRKNEAEAAEA